MSMDRDRGEPTWHGNARPRLLLFSQLVKSLGDLRAGAI